MAEFVLNSPLSIERARSKPFYLNQNIFRNTHYQTMNSMKKKYKGLMTSEISKLPTLNKIEIHYKLFPRTKRLCDVNNICSSIDKFFCDALVELGKLEDDNYLFLPRIVSEFGEIDKDNPRVEITIKEI